MNNEQLAAVLAEHQPKTGIRDLHKHCTCGWFGRPLGNDFLPHQAQAILQALFGAPEHELADDFQRNTHK